MLFGAIAGFASAFSPAEKRQASPNFPSARFDFY
ncbi:Hypothetical protein BROD_0100 [Brucella sp. NF 2653]|nr:Hypothetical protein BROD_0100 [Brucella sp. NF 2653]